MDTIYRILAFLLFLAGALLCAGVVWFLLMWTAIPSEMFS